MRTQGASIAVMPFRNLSSEPDTEYFANGFVEDLTAELTRFPSLRVLAFGELPDSVPVRVVSSIGDDAMRLDGESS